MLLIKTELKSSKIHGIGLFTISSIKKNTVIAELNSFDIKINLDQIPEEYLEYFNFYYSKVGTYYQTYFDNMKFMNHSDNPNCIDTEDGKCTAIKDIQAGEELTCDYSLICDMYKKH